ncbi:DNA translocase FtsK [Conservatibacter flavescens]|uniref:DNA translocase FtsK n=1 Tax=Conservatibacter flavescens TaxID=28161 RepID=A0A2M8S0R5_9PAST|nr:DNA translocase FtsK 4TM domain-containing protein [Conservatibacter flavescens]PJG84743.1 cell division protein FtsK [Conservatibacter flavescens]
MIEQIKARFTPKQYFVELLFGVVALLGLYLIIAWSSYSPIDSTWSVSSYQPETINKAGFLGAWLVDLFFALFGYIGNIIPFVLFIAPIYFIRTKLVDSLTWTRFSLRMMGFVLMLCGLTMLTALLFSDPVYYLSGGVLGGMLTAWLLPVLGKFGALLLAIALSSVGFVLCSGASLILLLVKFYHWLTIKNEEPTTENSTPVAEHNVQSTPITAEPSAKETRKNDFVDVTHFAKPEIKGLTPKTETQEQVVESSVVEETQEVMPQIIPTTISQATPHVQIESVDVSDFDQTQFDFQLKSDTPLPTVTIHDDYSSLMEKPVELELPTPVVKEESAVDFGQDFPTMPTISLAENESKTAFTVSLSDSPAVAHKDEDDEHFYALQKQFEEREAQRLAEMEQRAKALDAEDLFQNITTVSEREEQPEKQAPVYKPYENSLIHPLLQPTQTHTAKPTTPMPTLDLLDQHSAQTHEITEAEIIETSRHISQKLRDFGVKAEVEDVLVGPVVTRYELALQPGVKASKVTGIDRDLARALSFNSIRVAEVIPGKPYIGIEVPNKHRQTVWLRDVLNTPVFLQSKYLLPMALGKDISGEPIIIDLAKTPHLLVAGSTGSGKSVGVNTMILSLLFKVKPSEVKFIMIDPKVVELSIYNDIPHLLTPVVTDMKKAANALRWCVEEMERRYQLLSKLFVRNIEGYNEKIAQAEEMGLPIPNPIWKPGDSMDTMPPALEKMSYIVVIVDEFADLMMVAGKQIEELIARLTQKARAVGIHVILATQRPSVDVITGLIKSNIPSRIAFTVVQRNDSRTILDQNGAEALLGRGDMLYLGNGTTDLVRIHGAFMSDDEVRRIADDWRAREKPEYIDAILESVDDNDEEAKGASSDGDLDELFDEVTEFVVSTGTTSTSSIQRRFRVGFNRAARIMDQLEEQGIISAMQNGKREVLARRGEY